MKKRKKEKKQEIVHILRTSEEKRIGELVKEYPKQISCYPRARFEQQLINFIIQNLERINHSHG